MSRELIHKSDTAEMQVTTLVLTDKAGTGPCVVSAPSGTAFQLLGARHGIENWTSSYTIPQSKSGYTWTNTGAGSAIVFTLPTGALEGTSAQFIRTGAQISINPGNSSVIYIAESGFFRNPGQSAVLASSGARLALVSNGSNSWYPLYQMGTIQ